MITFFPGPSRVYPRVKDYLNEAFDLGILSISHRSEIFNALSKQTLELLHEKLGIPSDYTILYTSSATECWEILPQSLVNQGSEHMYSGSFGEKWFQYAQHIKPKSTAQNLEPNVEIAPDQFSPNAEMLCLTQNETSNGTQINLGLMQKIRESNPNPLIAYDVTSSLAGQALPFHLGDVWFGSVQKCFGLPSGLGLLILSPKAVEKAWEIGEKGKYNSLTLMLENIKKFQTSCTPNVLGIFLLNRVMQDFHGSEHANAMLKERAKAYYSLLDNTVLFSPLISNEVNRSLTVVAVESTAERIAEVKSEAKKVGILLGSGYGKWKETTFRIANFPALQQEDVDKLLHFLSDFK